jgi:cold shock CspA family protein
MAKRRPSFTPVVAPPAARASGIVKRLVADRGFGFIRDDEGTEYFFHRSECLQVFAELTTGTAVTFLIARGPKGLRAEAIELAL